MKIYGLFTPEGRVQGFWSDDVFLPQEDGSRHVAIPADAIELDPYVYEQLSADQTMLFVNGTLVSVPNDPIEVVIVKVTAAQAKLALYDAQLFDTVDALMRDYPYIPARIWYTTANEWEISNPYVQAIGSELGLEQVDINLLFNAAALK